MLRSFLRNSFKIFQSKVYSCLGTSKGVAFFFIVFLITLLAFLHLWETLAVLRTNYKEVALFAAHYRDNLLERFFLDKMVSEFPIDVVYTWVNGSDAKLLNGLARLVPERMQSVPSVVESMPLYNSSTCPSWACLSAGFIVINRRIQTAESLAEFKVLSPILSDAVEVLRVQQSNSSVDTLIAFRLTNVETVQVILNSTALALNGTNYTVTEGFLTAAGSGQAILPNWFVVEPHQNLTYSDIEQALAEFLGDSGLVVRSSSGIAVRLSSNHNLSSIPVNNYFLQLLASTLIWRTFTDPRDRLTEESSLNRFADNEELRYSLRSLERYAGWVRRVFIVTNGQVPHWLNLDHPRIQVVTHKQIFSNMSHLPTFSSPAIESHIHKIPGLSKRFIYLNDDLVFGKEVWPEDFFSESTGFKVYLAWPLPHCKDGCLSNWIKDGFCDRLCNFSECDWDGGDCLNTSKPVYQPTGPSFNMPENCNMGCSDSWLGDRYCDTSCNAPLCGYDAGDCGIARFGDLWRFSSAKNGSHQDLPDGIMVAYTRFDDLLPDHNITGGEYTKNEAVRSIIISLPHKVVVMILRKNRARSLTNVTIFGHQGNSSTIQLHFSLGFCTEEIPLSTTAVSSSMVLVHNESAHPSTSSTASARTVYSNNAKGLKNFFVSDWVGLGPTTDPHSTVGVSDRMSDTVRIMGALLKDGVISPEGYNLTLSYLLSQAKDEESPISTMLKFGGRKLHQSSDQQLPPLSEGVLCPSLVQMTISDVAHLHGRPVKLYSKGLVELRKQWENRYGAWRPWNTLLGQFSPLLPGIFPWESSITVSHEPTSVTSRLLMDSYADSLLYVNRLYNKRFGYKPRKVIAHMPFLIDRAIVNELQDLYHTEFDLTSSHRIRAGDDMQFAFSYFYYVLSVTSAQEPKQYLLKWDTDGSGTLSYGELYNVMVGLMSVPLTEEYKARFTGLLYNCTGQTAWSMEAWVETSIDTLLSCTEFSELLQSSLVPVPKYKHFVMDDSHIEFKMLEGNVTKMIQVLDGIRQRRRKFICLNDNLLHDTAESMLVRRLLADFYQSLFPLRSMFELPVNHSNPFQYYEDFIAAKENQITNAWTQAGCLLAALVVLLFSRRYLKGLIRILWISLYWKVHGSRHNVAI